MTKPTSAAEWVAQNYELNADGNYSRGSLNSGVAGAQNTEITNTKLQELEDALPSHAAYAIPATAFAPAPEVPTTALVEAWLAEPAQANIGVSDYITYVSPLETAGVTTNNHSWQVAADGSLIHIPDVDNIGIGSEAQRILWGASNHKGSFTVQNEPLPLPDGRSKNATYIHDGDSFERVEWEVKGAAAAVDAKLKYFAWQVDTVADLIVTDTAVNTVNVWSFRAGKQIGGGLYKWNPLANKTTHNGGSVIDPDVVIPTDWTDATEVAAWFTAGTTGTGCWIRENGDLVPECFGAYGEGVAFVEADTAAIRAFIEHAGSVAEFTPTADYHFNADGIFPSKPMVIDFKHCSITQNGDNSRLFYTDGINDMTYRNADLIGRGAGDTPTLINAESNTPAAQAIAIDFRNASGYTVDNCKVRGFKNTGIQFAYASIVNIFDCEVEGTVPDTDLPLLDTARQQFGIAGQATSSFIEGTHSSLIINGNGIKHANHTINIYNNRVGNTGIAFMIFPGYTGVTIQGNTTFGTLTQHSAYVYSYEDTQILANTFTPDHQAAGIKASLQATASRKNSEGLVIHLNTMRNTKGPGITLESFDRLLDGSLDLSKSAAWFLNTTITENGIYNFAERAMTIANTQGRIEDNIIEGGLSTTLSSIEFRTFYGSIVGNSFKNINFQPFGGTLSVVDKTTFKDNVMDDVMLAAGSIAMVFGTPSPPITAEAGRYYCVNTHTISGDDVYICIKSGFTDAIPVSTDGSVEVVGGAEFVHQGLFSALTAQVDLFDNDVRDSHGRSIGNAGFAFLGGKYEMAIKNNQVAPKFKNANRMIGLITQREGNNFYNAFHAQATYLNKGIGRNGNTFMVDSLTLPVSDDFYEVGDRRILHTPVAGAAYEQVCTYPGRSGYPEGTTGAIFKNLPALEA